MMYIDVYNILYSTQVSHKKTTCFLHYIHCLYIYIYAHPPRTYFFSISLTVSLQGQPSAICYLPKKQQQHKYKKTKKTKTKKQQCIGEPSPLPRSQRRSPKTFFFGFLSFSWYPPLPKPNPKQIIQNVCMFILSGVGERC